MKDYILKEKAETAANDKFLTGLVFGLDIRTGSIGYAVREGNEFQKVGVRIRNSESSGLRRQRRTLS